MSTSLPLRASFARDLSLGALFELFFLTAVASLLLIRGLLALSGFPKVGGGGLHIAHMLWGGLLMLASLLLLLGFIGRRPLYLAAFVAGAGFGTFIDELGKFITSDNNYFFRPAIAVMYVVFVLLFLVARALEPRRQLTDVELLANAFELAREAAVRHHRPLHTGEVHAYLQAHAGDDPLLVALRDTLGRAHPAPPPLPAPLRRAWLRALRVYVGLVESRSIQRWVGGLLAAYLVYLGISIAIALHTGAPLGSRAAIAGTGLFVSDVLSAALVLVAAVRLPTARGSALRWLDRAIVVDLLLAQVFAFYLLQFAALLGLALDVLLLIVVRGAIRAERRLAGQAQPSN